jgi:sterol desaturase/sphingolipid hydroxylase (fatty acid hydroxylase superfamily)
MQALIQFFTDAFAQGQQWVFEDVFRPLIFQLGLTSFLEDGYTAAGWFLAGCIQLVVLVAVIGPLERWRPVEPVSDRATIRTDVLYTLIHRLGLFRVALFFSIEPLMDQALGVLRTHGVATLQLDQMLGLGESAVASFLLYLVIFDLVDYTIHRAQHQFNWWWALHSLHHAQRQMTMWSDNRNHLLDDVLRDTIIVVVAQAIGVAPDQFIAIVMLTRLSESLQHANARLWFGRMGERLWVSPRFHRLHHAIGIGHESPKQVLGGHNFGVLLPWWDMLFGTANFEKCFDATGVRDQVEQGRDYGEGFWRQQWLGLLRLFGKA